MDNTENYDKSALNFFIDRVLFLSAVKLCAAKQGLQGSDYTSITYKCKGKFLGAKLQHREKISKNTTLIAQKVDHNTARAAIFSAVPMM